MRRWITGIALALVFTLVGAFLTSLWLEVQRETPAVRPELRGEWAGRSIRVEVLNGAGIDRLAQRATERLRGLGFDVVYYGNAELFGRDSSVAVARIDSLEPARRVADALGLQRVVLEPDENLYLDVTVLLGKDYATEPAQREFVEVRALELWWIRVKRAAGRLWPGGHVDEG